MVSKLLAAEQNCARSLYPFIQIHHLNVAIFLWSWTTAKHYQKRPPPPLPPSQSSNRYILRNEFFKTPIQRTPSLPSLPASPLPSFLPSREMEDRKASSTKEMNRFKDSASKEQKPYLRATPGYGFVFVMILPIPLPDWWTSAALGIRARS